MGLPPSFFKKLRSCPNYGVHLTTLIVGAAQAANANAAQASSAPVLTIEKLSLKVSAGRFEMYDGVNFVGSDNSAAILLSGAQTKGAIYGGAVTTDATLAYPANAFSVTDGAHIEAVRGGYLVFALQR